MPDWPALQRALWRAVRDHEARLDETSAQYRDAIVEAIREAEYNLGADAEQLVTDYLDAISEMIREGIAAAVVPITEALRPTASRSTFIAGRVADAYARRWPDGLMLSERVWRWQEATRRGVSEMLARGIAAERSGNVLVYDLQRAIEGARGERFAIEIAQVDDWARDLARTGRNLLRKRADINQWLATVEATRRHLGKLAEGGTLRQAKAVFREIREAVSAGSEEAIEKALGWWVYDRQLYTLRRVVRTEMATAYHRAEIAATYADADIIGYRWRLSASHPMRDICDLYASIELGHGMGVFPKDRLPAGKAHPHCMCSLTPVTRPQGGEGNTDWETLEAANQGPIELWVTN